MPHDPAVLLEDIRRAAQQILAFTTGRQLVDYSSDELLRAAVERFFITIGEALSRLEKIDASKVAQISEHAKIIAFRNILVHGYDVIDDAIVWQVIQQHLPVLNKQINDLLRAGAP